MTHSFQLFYSKMDHGGVSAILQLVAFFAAVDTSVAMTDDDSPVLSDNNTVKKNKTVNVGKWLTYLVCLYDQLHRTVFIGCPK